MAKRVKPRMADDPKCKAAIDAYKAEHDGNDPTRPEQIKPYFDGDPRDCIL